MTTQATSDANMLATIAGADPNGEPVRLRKPTPEPGPWRPHERRAEHKEHEVLLPPESFDNETATEEDLRRLLENPDPTANGANSQTVRTRLASSCAGWHRRPQPSELYAAIHAEGPPTDRQKCLLKTWVTETEWLELIQAWAERVYTLRELVFALHRAGITRSRHSRTLNRWANRVPEAP